MWSGPRPIHRAVLRPLHDRTMNRPGLRKQQQKASRVGGWTGLKVTDSHNIRVRLPFLSYWGTVRIPSTSSHIGPDQHSPWFLERAIGMKIVVERAGVHIAQFAADLQICGMLRAWSAIRYWA